MLIVLSPAKTLDYDTPPATAAYTLPELASHSAELIAILRNLSPAQISSLMRISDPLALLNASRYAAWSGAFTAHNSKQAVLAFNGDVYEGLDAPSLSTPQIDWLQAHLRILSGLYGILRPLDLMQPYRLEMGTRLANPRGKDLYAFWGDLVSDALDGVLREHRFPVLVNLASEEYFRVVRPQRLSVPVITPVFEDWKNGQYKVISFYAKRARGLMARYAAEHELTQVEQLKQFDAEGYAYDGQCSTATSWVFRRRI